MTIKDVRPSSVKGFSGSSGLLFVTPRDVDLYCSGTADRYGEAEQRHQVAVGADKHIKDIDFKVASGQRVALIGANGVGKSTVLRRVAGEDR